MIELTEGDLTGDGIGNVGRDSTIVYPGVFTCITITAASLASGDLVGGHFARHYNDERFEASITEMVRLLDGQEIQTLYIVGSLSEIWNNGSTVHTKYHFAAGMLPHYLLGTMKPKKILYFDTRSEDVTDDHGTKGVQVSAASSGTGLAAISLGRVPQLIPSREFSIVAPDLPLKAPGVEESKKGKPTITKSGCVIL